MDELKRFFTEKPEGNIWKRATIYLLILRYLGPLTLFFSIPIMMGLLAPNQEIDFTEMSETLSQSFVISIEKLYSVGSSIAIESPILSKVLVFAFSNIVWIFYVGLIFLLIDIFRHLTSWIYNKRRKISIKSKEKIK